MNLKIECSIGGFCGDKVAISQGKQARLVNYYSDCVCALAEKIHVLVVAECVLDAQGVIWIKNVQNKE